MEKEIQEIEAWINLRSTLNNSYDYNENWSKAIKLFETRLDRKFFKPLKTIIDKNILEGEGFTIVTIHCALIEALASFRTGQIFNYNKIKTSPNYEYKESKKMFINFLHTSTIFKDNFYLIGNRGQVIKDTPFNASDFYLNVRCGLMHEARTKGSWHINATKKDPKTEKVFIETADNKVKVFRTILHFKLQDCIKEYSKDLRTQTDNGLTLRRFFGRKLDHLFNIPADPISYEWWEDR